jgi:hypothetical protein
MSDPEVVNSVASLVGYRSKPNASRFVAGESPLSRHDAALQLSGFLRWLALLSAIALVVVLGVARYLTPASSGMGTHQQLGLPPCTSLMLWGKPCPACGMTTSWSYVTRGQLAAAAKVNCGGLLLALIALAVIPASCYFFVTGRATRGQWFSTALAVCLVVALGLATVQWIVRIWV